MEYVFGMDLGGSSIKGVVTTLDGERLEDVDEPFVDQDMAWAHQLKGLLGQFREKYGMPKAVGISAPGLAAKDGSCILSLPGRLHGLVGLDWSTFVGWDLHIPLLNDAQAALLGEVWLGAARGLENVCMLTLGTGVGGAAMVDGQLLRGHLGRAGHLGHIVLDWHGAPDDVGTPGSLETELGNKTVRERSKGKYQTTRDLVNGYLDQEPDAVRLWLTSMRALACGLSSLINVLDPEAIILGGGIARAGGALFEPVQRFLDPVEWRPGGAKVRLIPAQLGALAGAYGAGWNALSQLNVQNESAS
jgi:glucokinase